jgi:hypothetical protein
MGDRVSKSSVLSDPQVIELLNGGFNATELNVTDVGWPKWLEALAPWKAIYDSSPEARKAFTNMAVVDADGTVLLGSGDTGKIGRTKETLSMNYDPVRYLKMLQTAADRGARLEAIRKDEKRTPEEKTAALTALKFEVDQDLKHTFQAEPGFLQMVQSMRKQ